jgi:hypothetical protein
MDDDGGPGSMSEWYRFGIPTCTILPMTRPTVIGLMICALLLSGCRVDTEPQDVEHFSTNRAAEEDPAAYDGTYILYGDETAIVGPVLMKVHLKAGETVGFEMGQNHVPYAVAGPNRLKLSPGHYRWEMNPDPGQVDWDKTNVVIIEVVVATVVVAAAVVTAIVVSKHAGL